MHFLFTLKNKADNKKIVVSTEYIEINKDYIFINDIDNEKKELQYSINTWKVEDYEEKFY